MAKRGGKKNVLKWYDEKRDLPLFKKLGYTLLDAVIFFSFSVAIYTTYKGDYGKTILFLSVACVLMLFFIIRGLIKTGKPIIELLR